MSQREVKFLDLDALAPSAVLKIKLNGNEHEMKEMTVEDFVWATNESQKRALQEASENPDDPAAVADVVESMIHVLCRQFPTATEEDFRSLSFDRLSTLLNFTRSLVSEGAEVAVAQAEDEGKAVVESVEKTETAAPV